MNKQSSAYFVIVLLSVIRLMSNIGLYIFLLNEYLVNGNLMVVIDDHLLCSLHKVNQIKNVQEYCKTLITVSFLCENKLLIYINEQNNHCSRIHLFNNY